MTLFDLPTHSAPARPADPETSHQAAAANATDDVGRFSDRSRQAALLVAVAIEPRTAQEATAAVMPPDTWPSRWEACRRRMSDLAAVDYVTDTGQRRTNAGSSTESIVWGITPLGETALDNLERTGWSR